MYDLLVNPEVGTEIMFAAKIVALMLSSWGIPTTTDTYSDAPDLVGGEFDGSAVYVGLPDFDSENMRAGIITVWGAMKVGGGYLFSVSPLPQWNMTPFYYRVYVNPSSCGNGCSVVDWIVALTHEICHTRFDADACINCSYGEQMYFYRNNMINFYDGGVVVDNSRLWFPEKMIK